MGRFQSRLGPNRWGPFGIFQPIADGIKLLTKEDIVPDNADKKLMLLAPFIIFIGAFLTFIAVPFSEHLVVSDFNIGIFYRTALAFIFSYCVLYDSKCNIKQYSSKKDISCSTNITFFLELALWLWFWIYMGADLFYWEMEGYLIKRQSF